MSESLPSAEKDAGLEGRFRVEKIDDPAGKHDDCRYFVLDPQHDPIAREVLAFYAGFAERDGYTALSRDLREWLRQTRDLPPAEHSHPTGGAWNVTQWPVPDCPACTRLLPPEATTR